jgi:catechol 2,3-dioxygenase-like lactoylglutathione lyase family enzyme
LQSVRGQRSRQREGAMDPVVTGVHHVALRVADVERAVAFYQGALGLPVLRRLAANDGLLRAAWLRAGTSVLMLEQTLRGEGPGAGSGHVLALTVTDLAAWIDLLGGRGIRVTDRTPHTLYFADPDGHRVGLSVFPTDCTEPLPQTPPERYTHANPIGES